MWFMPSYGRPNCFERLVKAPGGMPAQMYVIVNADDPCLEEYKNKLPEGWSLYECPAGLRLAGVYHWIYERWENLSCYGLFADDHVPQTPNWHKFIADAAENRYLAYPNGADTEFPLMRGICALGGDLVRELGWIVPKQPALQHHYFDVVMDDILRPVGLLKPLENIFIDHLHWKFGKAQMDATYARGGADEDEDAQKYYAWVNSFERASMHRHLTAWKATWAAS